MRTRPRIVRDRFTEVAPCAHSRTGCFERGVRHRFQFRSSPSTPHSSPRPSGNPSPTGQERGLGGRVNDREGGVQSFPSLVTSPYRFHAFMFMRDPKTASRLQEMLVYRRSLGGPKDRWQSLPMTAHRSARPIDQGVLRAVVKLQGRSGIDQLSVTTYQRDLNVWDPIATHWT